MCLTALPCVGPSMLDNNCHSCNFLFLRNNTVHQQQTYSLSRYHCHHHDLFHHDFYGKRHASRGLRWVGWNHLRAGRATCSETVRRTSSVHHSYANSKLLIFSCHNFGSPHQHFYLRCESSCFLKCDATIWYSVSAFLETVHLTHSPGASGNDPMTSVLTRLFSHSAPKHVQNVTSFLAEGYTPS